MKYFDEMRALLLERLDTDRELEEREIREGIDELLLSCGRRPLTLKEREELGRELFYSVRGLDVLQELADDPEITEIMVNGYRNIFYERKGRLYRWEKCFSAPERLEDVIQQIAAGCNRAVNEQTPILDARLEGGERVNVVMAPVALNGPALTIRKFPEKPVTMEILTAWDSITPEAADFLKNLVRARYTIFVGGGTSTGKTTFLNALSRFIPEDERIVTIEDTAELQLQGTENLVRLEVRPETLQGGKEIGIRQLIRTALRMRPGRIIIGEVRGAEAADFLNCLNTGHEGSLGSAHANSIRDMIGRLETMALMGRQMSDQVIRRQIAAGIEILVHLERDSSGRRRVQEIGEVTGIRQGEVQVQPLYRRNRQQVLEPSGCLERREKLEKWQEEENGKGKNPI